jgi:hypothetical protein
LARRFTGAGHAADTVRQQSLRSGNLAAPTGIDDVTAQGLLAVSVTLAAFARRGPREPGGG